MAVAILLSLIGFGLWLAIDLPPLARSFLRRAVAMALASASLAAAYLRALPLGRLLGLPPGVRVLGTLLNVLGMAMVLYSVFVEIPLRQRAEAGRQPLPPQPSPGLGPARPVSNQPVLVTSGTYALCRHPGVLWLVPLLAGGALSAARTGFVWLSLIWLALDVLHAAVQDRFIFPIRFDGYRAYQRATPFLIPTPASIRRFLKTESAHYDAAIAKNQ